jgi:hypothetical protein
MILLAKIISWTSLVGLTVPSLMFASGRMELDQVKTLMTIASVIWFVTASAYMWKSDVDKT